MHIMFGRIANFERACMELAYQNSSKASKSKLLVTRGKVFIGVTNTFGQIYVQKDIASTRLT
jgi:hypothetical protein